MVRMGPPKSRFRRAKGAWVNKILFLSLLVTTVGFARPNWESFQNNQFPTFVQEVEFPGGSTLRANANVSFGAWTVRFKTGSMPIMVGYNGSFIYTIHGLMAHNEVAGDFPCMIYYMDGANFGAQKRGEHKYQWNLGILLEPWDPANTPTAENHPNFYNNGILSIPFPVGIRLNQ